jgi:hypothetical protein
VKFFRKNKDLRRVAEHQRLLQALGNVVTSEPAPAPTIVAEPELAQVVSLATLRARRVGHPSAGGRSDAPVTARL